MTDNSITIEGLEEVIQKIDDLDKPGLLVVPMKEATAHVQSTIAKYPAEPGGRPQPFKTEKQRRYFFWALRSGRITVPYKRRGSGGLGGAWTTEISADGREGRVGNNKPYARVVQDETYQFYSHYHRQTGWPTIQIVAREEAGAVKGYFERQYEKHAKS